MYKSSQILLNWLLCQFGRLDSCRASSWSSRVWRTYRACASGLCWPSHPKIRPRFSIVVYK